MEVIGKVKKIGEAQTFGSGFTKKELIITTEEQYPQHVMIEFTQDKINLLDSLSEGDDVKVSINLRGREWINPEGVAKYFNSLQGWRVEKNGTASSGATASNAALNTEIESNPSFSLAKDKEEFDDLPF